MAMALGDLSAFELEIHLAQARYGDLMLTEAIRPGCGQTKLKQGFRRQEWNDGGIKVPTLVACCSRENLLDVFCDLLDQVGSVVDVIIESSHKYECNRHDDYCREGIDLPVLKSVLLDYEDLLLDDGCFGIAVLDPSTPIEIQFDEHKLLITYSRDTKPLEAILERYGVSHDESLQLVTEGEHVHCSKQQFIDRFDDLRNAIGAEFYQSETTE